MPKVKQPRNQTPEEIKAHYESLSPTQLRTHSDILTEVIEARKEKAQLDMDELTEALKVLK